MKAKQLTHKEITLRTYIHRYPNTYIHAYLPIYLPTYLPTYIPPSSLHHSHTSSSLQAFSLSLLSLSLKKLVTCGVIRSFNFNSRNRIHWPRVPIQSCIEYSEALTIGLEEIAPQWWNMREPLLGKSTSFPPYVNQNWIAQLKPVRLCALD